MKLTNQVIPRSKRWVLQQWELYFGSKSLSENPYEHFNIGKKDYTR